MKKQGLGKLEINIKKKNVGSFTEYCKGSVTNKCIDKGLGSPNETTRKRAQFAKNARQWNHSGSKGK